MCTFLCALSLLCTNNDYFIKFDVNNKCLFIFLQVNYLIQMLKKHDYGDNFHIT